MRTSSRLEMKFHENENDMRAIKPPLRFPTRPRFLARRIALKFKCEAYSYLKHAWLLATVKIMIDDGEREHGENMRSMMIVEWMGAQKNIATEAGQR